MTYEQANWHAKTGFPYTSLRLPDVMGPYAVPTHSLTHSHMRQLSSTQFISSAQSLCLLRILTVLILGAGTTIWVRT